VPQAIDTIIETYLANRTDGEDFLATWRRVGPAPFKEALYGAV
jgi:sulfite reductase (NADPH) hemoprotein beta-component